MLHIRELAMEQDGSARSKANFNFSSTQTPIFKLETWLSTKHDRCGKPGSDSFVERRRKSKPQVLCTLPAYLA